MTKAVIAILLGGLIAGALDITYACVHYGLVYEVPPTRIFQSVAAGVFGRDEARAGGLTTAGIGLALHFLLTTIMAAFFVAWTRMVPGAQSLAVVVWADIRARDLRADAVRCAAALGSGRRQSSARGSSCLVGCSSMRSAWVCRLRSIAKRFAPQQA